MSRELIKFFRIVINVFEMEAGPSNEHSQPKNLILVSPVESGIMNILYFIFLSIRKQENWLSLVFLFLPVSTKLFSHSCPIEYGPTEFSSPISPIFSQLTYILSRFVASGRICTILGISLSLSLLFFSSSYSCFSGQN